MNCGVGVIIEIRVDRQAHLSVCVCVCVCACACVCELVYMVYEDTNLYNNMGITTWRWFMRTLPMFP